MLESVGGDTDKNGVEEISACFLKTDLRLLFSDLRGTNSVTVAIEGSLFTGGRFRAMMDIQVSASGGGNLAASISPNPLNPDAILTFRTEREGPARVDLFDVGGRRVRSLLVEANLSVGYHDVRIDGNRFFGTVESSRIGDAMATLMPLGVTSLTVEPPSLESLFLRLYGAEASQ